MAIYHFHVSQVGRGKGQSVVAAAAYRAGEKLCDNYYGVVQDYTRKGGVITSGIILPEHAPAQFYDRETLWNDVEKNEKHPRAQLAYSFDMALPVELPVSENIRLAEDFIVKYFVAKGMICDYAIHDPDKGTDEMRNPHVHVLVPIRPLKKNGEWDEKQHREYMTDEKGERRRDKNGRYVFKSVPTTDWGRPETLRQWRVAWADMVNERLAERGISETVDHRSYAAQGIEIIPRLHEGSAVRRMEYKGIKTDIGSRNEWIEKTQLSLAESVKGLSELAGLIKEAKAEIQEIGNRLRHPTEPNVVDYLMDYFDQRDKKAATYQYGRKKAELTNLRKKAAAYFYIEKYDLRSIDALERHFALRKAEIERIQSIVAPMETEIKHLRSMLRYMDDYKKYQPIYEESCGIYFTSAKREYQNKHRQELNRFQRARRVLTEAGIKPEDYERSEGLWRYRMEKLEKEMESTLSDTGKAGLDEEMNLLNSIQKAVDEGIREHGIMRDTSSDKQPYMDLGSKRR